MGTWFGNTALICGQIFPLKLLLSTVLRTTGRANTLAAFASATVLLMIDWRFEIRNAKEHLRLVIDQRDHAIVRGQQSFLGALCPTIFVWHGFLLFEVS